MHLIDPARRPVWTFVAAMTATTITLTLCSAAMAAAPARSSGRHDIVTVRLPNAKPQTEAEAQRLLRTLGNAALEVCGASSFSLADVKAAVRRSACWHETMARAVTEADSQMLAEAYARAANRNHAG